MSRPFPTQIVINDGLGPEELDSFIPNPALGPRLLLTTTGGGEHDVDIIVPNEDDHEVVRRASLAQANVQMVKVSESKPGNAHSEPTSQTGGNLKAADRCACCSVM